ncbi:MAG: hypothetical protein WCA46_06870 [Actinocatenispora sp.]
MLAALAAVALVGALAGCGILAPSSRQESRHPAMIEPSASPSVPCPSATAGPPGLEPGGAVGPSPTGAPGLTRPTGTPTLAGPGGATQPAPPAGTEPPAPGACGTAQPGGALPPGAPTPGYPTGYPTGYGTPGYPPPANYPTGGPSMDTTCPAGAPNEADILSMARHVSDGQLPADTAVTDRRCAAGYLVADLTAPQVGTVHAVLHDTGTGWRAVAVGSYPCRDVRSAPPDARTLLGCGKR